MYVNIIDTLQKKLSDDLPSFQGTKIWKLRTITRSGSGDTLAVSRVGFNQLGDIHRGTGTWNSWFQDFETFGVSC